MKKILSNKNKLTFSIVLCTYNRENHIRKCLDSLMQLDFSKEAYEIIVVDDGSTDNTIEIVKEYPVKLVQHQKNQGIAAARNTGLKYAKGDIYVCFDDDCYVDSDWLKKLAKAYESINNNDVAGIGGFIELQKNGGLIEKYMGESGYGNPSPAYYGKSKNIFGRFFSYLKNMFSPQLENQNNTFEVSEIWGANSSFPIAILNEIGGWDEHLSGVEDTDLCNRIKKHFQNKKFYCTREAILYHDHKLSVKDLLLKPYYRGPAILRFYNENKKVPPIFPFPIAILTLSTLLGMLNPFYGIASLFILPQLFYSWWVLLSIKKRKIYVLVFSYLQAGYELFSILGLVKGVVHSAVKLSSRKLLFLLLLFGISTNLVILNDVQFYYSRELAASLYLLLTPGILIAWVMGIRYKNIWNLLVYTVGLSIATLMVFGLGINYLLPLLQNAEVSPIPSLFPTLTKPLEMIPYLVSFDILLGLMWIYSFIKNNTIPFSQETVHISIKSTLLGVIPTILPILSILGAIALNNNDTTPFTMYMLGITAGFVFLLTILREKISEHIFPYSLFMISLSLLLMTSLRGWYITGHDIFLEYFVFQLTKSHGIWSMANFQDPYTACLSITILPTIISNITHINDLYIYKALYQVIFSISIVATYLFIRKFVTPFFAFLASFAIVSLPTFMTDMPMLNRQEIALEFFALLLLTLFNKEFSKRIKWFFFIVLGFGMLLSHYSTTYIAVMLFIGAFLLHFPIRLLQFHPNLKKLINFIDKKLGIVDSKPNLHVGMIVVLVVATIVWNVNITNTASGIITTINKVVNDLQHHTIAKSKSDPASYGLLSSKAPTPQQLLNSYISTTTTFVRQFNDDTAFLNKTIYSQYLVTVGHQERQPLTPVGNYISHFHINLFSLNDLLKQLYAKVVQIFIIIGFIAIFVFRKHISNLEKEYLILTVTFFGILVMETILPGGSIDYGILRLFQQGMILFSVPLLMGGLGFLSVFNIIHKSLRIYLLSGIIIFFFLYLSGFIPQLTGGYYPQLNLANGGFYYDAYYTHTQDKVAMDWLAKNQDKITPVQSDWFALKKIHTYEQFYSIDGLIPSVIRRNSYVYLSVSNLQTGEVIVYVNGAPLYYKYSFSLLDEHKNLIYNNGGSKIYR